MFSDKINKFPGKQLVKLQACTITTELYLKYFPWNFPKYSDFFKNNFGRLLE